MKIHKIFVDGISTLNDWVGRISAFLIPLIMIILSCEVVLRYIFNRPTIWAMETSQLLMCTFVGLGGAYTALKGGHVNVDIVVDRLTPRKRAAADLVTVPPLLVFLSVFLWKASESAFESVEILERSGTFYDPPIYPVKVFMALGALLLLLQALAKSIEDIRIVVKGQTHSLSDKMEGVHTK